MFRLVDGYLAGFRGKYGADGETEAVTEGAATGTETQTETEMTMRSGSGSRRIVGVGVATCGIIDSAKNAVLV